MENQTSDIGARLEKLERENRRMKKIGIVAAVLGSAISRTVDVSLREVC